MALVSHAYGRGLPQPHGIWYQRHTSIDFISVPVQDSIVPHRTVLYFSFFLAFVFDPASPTAGHLCDGLELEENYFCLQVIDTDSFLSICICGMYFFHRSFKGTLQAGIWPVRCSERNRNKLFILLSIIPYTPYRMPFTDVRKVLLITTWISSCFFSFANVYHYPPLVIMAESQPRLYFKYKWSLGAETDAAWTKAESFLLTSITGKPHLRPYSARFRPSWRLSCHASTCGNVPVMLVWSCQSAAEEISPSTI